MIPKPFRQLGYLRVLNAIAVGAALGAIVGPVLGVLFRDMAIAKASALSSAAIGAIWAVLLRVRATVGRSRLRWGWLASVPLAILNTSLALWLADVGTPLDDLPSVLFFSSIFGAIVWVPALLATLLLFGTPIATAQRLASQGLAGEERGERIVGFMSAGLGVAGLLFAWANVVDPNAPPYGWLGGERLFLALALLAAAAGGTAGWLALARERRRKAFVVAVERGEVSGYRVQASPMGKVLVRISYEGHAYRGSEHEALVELDEAGAVTRALP